MTSGSYILSASSSELTSAPWGMRCVKVILFVAECSNVTHYLHVIQLWVSVLIAIYYMRILFDWGISTSKVLLRSQMEA